MKLVFVGTALVLLILMTAFSCEAGSNKVKISKTLLPNASVSPSSKVISDTGSHYETSYNGKSNVGYVVSPEGMVYTCSISSSEYINKLKLKWKATASCKTFNGLSLAYKGRDSSSSRNGAHAGALCNMQRHQASPGAAGTVDVWYNGKHR